MIAQQTTLNAKSVVKLGLRQPIRLLVSLLSLRYFLLRCSTAGAALVSGLVQTFVFVRVLTPEHFSIFILIGIFGMSLWLFDLGVAKILFVRQRERHLTGCIDHAVPAQSSAIVLLYGLIVLAGTLLCFMVMISRPLVTAEQAMEFALFFSFAALNLVWFSLRNISNAVDEYISFETLEAIRRIGHISMTLALLIGLSLPGFLLLANLLWVVLLAICLDTLLRKGALALQFAGFGKTLTAFWRANRAEIMPSGKHAIGELTIYNFPYLVVPLAFGLGAPTIILDTVFKILRGAMVIQAAGLDPLIPHQTRAFAEFDAATLKRATLTATILCAIPTVAICALLLLAGDQLFALLLGSAATIPPAVTPILVILLLADMAQNIAVCLLQHTGYFHQIARVATFLVVAMAAMVAMVLIAGADIVGFIGAYTAVYVMGAALYIGYVVSGPFQAAAAPKSSSGCSG